MADTERKLSRTRFSTFDWTSTIRKPGSIMALASHTIGVGLELEPAVDVVIDALVALVIV